MGTSTAMIPAILPPVAAPATIEDEVSEVGIVDVPAMTRM